MMRCIVLLGALLAMAGPALAQPPQPDGEQLALARRMVEATGGREQMQRLMLQMLDAQDKAIGQALGPEMRALRAPLMSSMRVEMIDMVPQLVEVTVNAYADNLTATELRDMLAFQESPSGKSIKAKMPAVMNEMIVKTSPLVASRMPAMLSKSFDNICRQQTCTPAQRGELERVMAKLLAPQTAPAAAG